MADDGFDFQKPQRREAKRFEPPPWEKEAFEEFQKRKAEDEQARALPEAEQADAAAVPAEVEADAAPEEDPEPARPEPEDKRADQMLIELAAQEPRENEGLWTVALGAAILVGAIGGVLIIWAMAALVGARRSGATGVAGGLVLLIFGAGFVSGAVWLAVRTLRQRGVL